MSSIPVLFAGVEGDILAFSSHLESQDTSIAFRKLRLVIFDQIKCITSAQNIQEVDILIEFTLVCDTNGFIEVVKDEQKVSQAYIHYQQTGGVLELKSIIHQTFLLVAEKALKL